MKTKQIATKLMVTDLDAADVFYRDIIGLTPVSRQLNGEGEWEQEQSFFKTGEEAGAPMLHLCRYANRAAPKAGAAWLGLLVSGLGDMVPAVERSGGKVLMPITVVEGHGVKVAIVTDPEGHLLELLEMLETH